jgi:tetratricopeptide (TPR) repeat protein
MEELAKNAIMYGSSKENNIPALRDAAKRDPKNETVWLNLAEAAEAKGDRTVWMDALQKLVALCPSIARYRFQLGVLLREEHKNEDARRMFEQVLEISPMHYKARQHLAEMSGVVIAKPVEQATRKEDFIPVVPRPKMTEIPAELLEASRTMSDDMIKEIYGKKKRESTPNFRSSENLEEEPVVFIPTLFPLKKQNT